MFNPLYNQGISPNCMMNLRGWTMNYESQQQGIYPTKPEILENRMNYTNTDDNSTTEIKSYEFTVDHDGFYDPSDDLAELHLLASFIDEPLLGNLPKPLVSPRFGAETKDIHGVEQSSDEFRSSSNISALESSSCSGSIPTCTPDVTAPRKVRSITARVPFSNWDSSSPALANSNTVFENCPNSYTVFENCPNSSVSANAAVSTYSDFLSSEQAKFHPSNRLSETDSIPTCIPDVTAPGKVRSITARVPFSNWDSSSPALANSNTVLENCPNSSVSANADVSSSNRLSETDRVIESKCEDATEVIKCMNCNTQKTSHLFSNWDSSSPALANSNSVLENCPNSFVSANAAVSSSNRLSETDRVIEAKCEDATEVIKCMNCDTQKTSQWIDGEKTKCAACHTRYTRVGNLHHFVSEQDKCHCSNKISKRNQGIKKKEQGKLHVIKCMHCGTRKTPQWRAGPMRPKTLCNACGMRYRSGRLVPEYRPSTSPTFSVDKHSNSHKKILEMIGEKEFISQASAAKQTCSGSEVQASYMKPSQEVLENCPNSSLFSNTAVSSGSDYFASTQTKSDSLKEITKTKQGIMRKGQDAMKVRKCVDCGSQRSRQWRVRPMDSKTPCNTCGVKYRSGGSVPEYRPVASPTFSVDKHSYSHKLVLERKAQKELAYQEKQTHIASEVQDSCAEPPQNGLEDQPKSFLSANASVCSVSKQANSDPLKKIQKTNQGFIRKVQNAMKVRKCMHCSTSKTPQWRDGPMGPKTLCNACGVRYRSGKLLPEYRPAASPTFSANKHSNSHKKVLEMRNQKELAA